MHEQINKTFSTFIMFLLSYYSAPLSLQFFHFCLPPFISFFKHFFLYKFAAHYGNKYIEGHTLTFLTGNVAICEVEACYSYRVCSSTRNA